MKNREKFEHMTGGKDIEHHEEINGLIDELFKKWEGGIVDSDIKEDGKRMVESTRQLLGSFDLEFLKEEQVNYLKEKCVNNKQPSMFNLDKTLDDILGLLRMFKEMSK